MNIPADNLFIPPLNLKSINNPIVNIIINDPWTIISVNSMWIGLMISVNPRTATIFIIFEPIILPITIPE